MGRRRTFVLFDGKLAKLAQIPKSEVDEQPANE